MQTGELLFKYAVSYGVFGALTCISRAGKGPQWSDPRGLIRLQIAGILWLGILPAAIFDQPFLLVVAGNQPPGLLKPLLVFLLCISAVAVSGRLSDRAFARLPGPVTRHPLIAGSTGTHYFLLRICFLVAYETWFRGYLLDDCSRIFGTGTAVFINVSLYTLLHCFSPPAEILACIPFGILLCILCIRAGAAWPAIVLHVTFAVRYEYKLMTRLSTIKNVLT